MSLKHVGRIAKTGKRIIVAYRVLPGDPEYCLVVTTESLDADQHDSLIKLVESNAGQSAYELAEAMSRVSLPDGRNMLAGFHMYGKLLKIAATEVEMIPDTRSSINLAELNQVIATQKGVTIADLAIGTTNKADAAKVADQVSAPVAESAEVLSDAQIATKLRSQAAAMFKEAKRLRTEADQLSPSKSTKKAASAK